MTDFENKTPPAETAFPQVPVPKEYVYPLELLLEPVTQEGEEEGSKTECCCGGCCGS